MNKLKELNRVHGNENGLMADYCKMYAIDFESLTPKTFKLFIRSIDVDSMDLVDMSEGEKYVA